jgi:thiol-disulfide isomerase/thioredoxin
MYRDKISKSLFLKRYAHPLNPMATRYIKAILIIFILSILVFNLYIIPAKAQTKPAPNFTLRVLNSKLSGYKFFSLNKFKGHVVIINFWATWCPPCRAEIPHLVKFYNIYKNKGVVVVGINVNETVSGVKTFTKLYNMPYPVVHANSGVLSDYGGINTIPQTFFISKSGKIMFHWVGEISRNTLYLITKKLVKMR